MFFGEVDEVRQQIGAERQMTAEQIGRHRRAALVGDAVEHDAGLQLQQLVGNMAHGADASLSNGELPWLSLRHLDHRRQA